MKLTNPPILHRDRNMQEAFGSVIDTRAKIERFIVWNLIAHLVERGFDLTDVDDGEELTKTSDAVVAMNFVFNLYESTLRFKRKGCKAHIVDLVMGNGWDVISGYSYIDGYPDGFDAAMVAYDTDVLEAAFRSMSSQDDSALATVMAEMLAVLQEYLDYNGEFASSHPKEAWVNKVRAVVAKVKGETP
jgi:hypothetical protein